MRVTPNILPAFYMSAVAECRCHLGQRIMYDTVTQRGWSVDSRTHSIQYIVDKLLNEDWDVEAGIEVPPVDEQTDCVVGLRFSFPALHD